MHTTHTQPDDQPTCGKGLAANAALPAKLAELVAAQAEVLDRHTQAIDLSDPNAKRELDTYSNLVRAHRALAGDLASVAESMAGARDLPMPRHDMTVMTAPEGQPEAFRRFAAIERDLVALLQSKLEQDARLLG